MNRTYAFALAVIATCAAMETRFAFGQSNDRPPSVRSTTPWVNHPFPTEPNRMAQIDEDLRRRFDQTQTPKGAGYEFGEGLIQGLFSFLALPCLALRGGVARVWSETLGNDSWFHVAGFILGCICLIKSAAKQLR